MNPIKNKGSTLMPKGLAERESNQSPPQTDNSATVTNPVLKLAYTTRLGNKSTCAPSKWRTPLMVASRKTTTKATVRIRMVLSQFMVEFKVQSSKFKVRSRQ